MVKRELSATSQPVLDPLAGEGAPEVAADPLRGSEDLLLWALACGFKSSVEWVNSTKVTQVQLDQLKQRHAPRLVRFRLLRALGELLGRSALELLLRARVAEQLLADGTPADLERIARVVERLAEPGAAPVPAKAGSAPEPEDDLAGMDLETAIAEARRLLVSLEDTPDD